MNKQVEKLIIANQIVINNLKIDRENCVTDLAWDAVNEIIRQKRKFITDLKDCL